jgi:DNA-binding response OmpR family regulator
MTAARVLIAEDEPGIIASLEFLMSRSGYDIRVAPDGAAALEQLAAFRPDLVILDIMLPQVSGVEVCREIRRRPEWRSTRVLMLSARGGASEIDRGLSAGADDYVTKPFSTHELVRRVGLLLEHRGGAEGVS